MYREFFPVTRNLTYLNHAAVGPLCLPASEAMQGLAQDALDWGSLHYEQWLECYAGLRRGAARLVNGTAEEIAIVKNTSEGIAIERVDGDCQNMAPVTPARAEAIARAWAKRRAAIDELPGLAEHHEFNLRVIEGMQKRIDALIALINRQLDGDD